MTAIIPIINLLVDEADLETHGMGYDWEGKWDWTRWSMLSNAPEWREAYVDRAARLYERDKNRGCVIFWSLGNESGCGVNHRAMRDYRAAGKKPLLLGTITNTLTTPDPCDLFRLLREARDNGTDTVIMEASSHALALRKLDAISPEFAVFTNLTPEHLDFHGTMEHYFRAKASLFQKARYGIINADDSYASELARGSSAENRFYSDFRDDADFTAKNIRYQGPVRRLVYCELDAETCAPGSGLSARNCFVK